MTTDGRPPSDLPPPPPPPPEDGRTSRPAHEKADMVNSQHPTDGQSSDQRPGLVPASELRPPGGSEQQVGRVQSPFADQPVPQNPRNAAVEGLPPAAGLELRPSPQMQAVLD